MAKIEEYAAVSVNGQSYRDWKTVTVNRTFGQASTFTMSAASPAESGTPTWGGLKLKVSDKASVFLAGRKVFDGVIATRQVAYTDREHGLQVTGLSRFSDIVQSTVDHTKGEFKKSSLSQIANALTAPHGIKFYLKGSTQGADKPFDKFNVQAGETIYAAIERLCRFRNIFMVDDAEGNIIGYRAGPSVPKIADLQEGRNIKSAQVVMSDENALSKIEAVGQRPGNNDHYGDEARDVSATALNAAVNRFRPFVFMAEMPGDKTDMQMRADHELAENYVTMLQGTITVQGWLRDDGSLWIEHVGDIVSVYSPMIFPNNRMSLAIQGVTAAQAPGGTETILDLCLPGRLGGGNRIETSAGGIPGLVS